jgi:hypothetical protein
VQQQRLSLGQDSRHHPTHGWPTAQATGTSVFVSRKKWLLHNNVQFEDQKRVRELSVSDDTAISLVYCLNTDAEAFLVHMEASNLKNCVFERALAFFCVM